MKLRTLLTSPASARERQGEVREGARGLCPKRAKKPLPRPTFWAAARFFGQLACGGWRRSAVTGAVGTWAPTAVFSQPSMPSEEKQFWYALTLAASGFVMIGTNTQTGWGIFLTLAGVVWLVYLERERIRAGLRNFLNAGEQQVTIKILSPANSAEVPYRKRVEIVAQPAGGLIQVFVQAGLTTDPWWYRQDTRMAKGDTRWTAQCHIGNKSSPNGSRYCLCAITGAPQVSDRRIKELPQAGVKSAIISVTLNHNLPDEWKPMVALKG